MSRGVAAAAAPPDGLTETQRLVLEALVNAMTGHPAALDQPGIGPEEFAEALRYRSLDFRCRIVQNMLLIAFILRPIPEEVVDRIAEYAAELNVEEAMVRVAHHFAEGSLGLAAFDFDRNGYTAHWQRDDARSLHASVELTEPWDVDVHDPELFDRWKSLEDLPDGSIGRRVTDFYRARGFTYPGRLGSAPPLLAQHDWVHVLADYGTTVESELEVFAFIARANDDMRGFSLLAMIVSLFETGYLQSGAGLFEASPGHLSKSGMAVRLADAMRRGALCHGSIDYLRTDWFDLAKLSVEEARGHFGVSPKSPIAEQAGSVGPWERGGISPFQVRSGITLASAEGRPYEAYGAEVEEPV
ncbi:MAG TPA: hypothetical protein VFV02_00090 [Acidimicrobiales bacterium]|nr:hypothetical protein [Acidimicrobiales bacterium]